jgi:hypothetical protein
MNIFYLDKNPKIAAKMHCDKHVVKMVLEYAQILSTAHRVIDGDEVADREGLYKIAHKNHPSTAWARLGRGNYNWLSDLWSYLGEEYTHRYGKVHKSSTLEWLVHPPHHIPYRTLFTGPTCVVPQCMPFNYKCNPNSASLDDVVYAYRSYYIGEKYSFAKWTNRSVPEWFQLEEVAA